MPLVGPAYLAHTLRSDHKPEDDIERLIMGASIDSYSLPTFKHGLLNYDWAPKLHVGPLDKKMFNKGVNKFSGLLELDLDAEQLKRKRAAEALHKKKKEKKEKKEKLEKRELERQRLKEVKQKERETRKRYPKSGRR